jgi:hypothetical protein
MAARGGLGLALFAIPAMASSSPVSVTGPGFTTTTENPTVKAGERGVIVATLSARPGYRITASYRHRIADISAAGGSLEISAKVVRGSVEDGRIVFRVDVRPKTPGTHTVIGVFRFSVHDGRQLDIRAAPFEATVTATE